MKDGDVSEPVVAGPAATRPDSESSGLMHWARERAAELLSDLPGESPLRSLLLDASGQTSVEPSSRPPASPTVTPTVAAEIEALSDGSYRVEARCASWEVFVERFGADLEKGRCFVECMQPPPLSSRVVLRIRLPSGAKDLGLQGEVVHVRRPEEAFDASMRPGFGLQLEVTPIRGRKLAQVVQRARAGLHAEESPTGEHSASSSCLRLFISDREEVLLRELQRELRALQAADDRARLGLHSSFAPEDVYAAFFHRTQYWRERAAGHAAPEIHEMVHALADLLQVSCARLRSTVASRLRSTRPATAPEAKQAPVPTSEPAPVPDRAPIPVSRDKLAPSGLMARKLRAAWSKARGLMSPGPQPPPTSVPARTRPSSGRPTELALARRAIGRKRFDEAFSILRRTLREAHGEEANSLRAWIAFTEARQAGAQRDFDRAIDRYQTALRIDPHFELAEKELLIMRCVAAGRV